MYGIKSIAFFLLFFLLAGCGGSGGAPELEFEPEIDLVAELPRPDSFPNIADPVEVQGRVTFDFIPVRNDIIGGLDYSDIQKKPVRAAFVIAINSRANKIIAATNTDNDGLYALKISKNTDTLIRVYSSIQSSIENPAWSSTVSDNTNNNQRYFIQSSVVNIDRLTSDINIHAKSGWLGDVYDDKREAGPFAILDTLYTGFTFIERIDPFIKLPELFVSWSKNNRPALGQISDGNIRTSSFDKASNTIFLLGADGLDTDEYDQSVIVHEFWHFLEQQLFRSHNIGGPHSETDLLDVRVAFSEGLAHAAAGMILGTNTFTDTVGPEQTFGGRLRLEEEPVAGHNEGWFSRSAVHLVFYDLFDSNQDEGDYLALGFGPIYRVLTSSDFIHGDALSTLYKFADVFSQLNQDKISEFSAMLAHRGINSLDSFAEGEDHNFDPTRFLPLYLGITEQEKKTFCTSNLFGEPNKLDNYQFIKLTVDRPGIKNLTLTTNNRTVKDVTGIISIYHKSDLQNILSFDLNLQKSTLTYNFERAGIYVLTYHESDKVDNIRDAGFPECVDLFIDSI